MQILNIAGYKFIPLEELDTLRQDLLAACQDLKGTILLSEEGINISGLSGTFQAIETFKDHLKQDTRFADMHFHETYSIKQPFRFLKVKIKKEIITLGRSEIDPTKQRAPSIQPELFKQWLDEKRDIAILDTRNDYEMQFGTFNGALNLNLSNFGEFPKTVTELDKEKTVVMFCTGGIRCEKAALYLMNQGFNDVYQLDGGILNYFAKVGSAHYHGECFVFDERIAVNAELEVNGTQQCAVCQAPVTISEQSIAAYVPGISCPACVVYE